MNEIDIRFEITALVTSIKAVNDIQLPMCYFMESKRITFEDIINENIINEKKLDGSSVQGNKKKIWFWI